MRQVGKNLIPLLAWVIFNAGLTEFLLVLTNPLISLISTVVCGAGFGYFISTQYWLSEFSGRTAIFLTTALTLILKLFYVLLVVLENQYSYLLAIISAVLFASAAAVSFKLFQKKPNGPK